MYKKITHTIVEEHFDHPLAVDIKGTFKPPLRYYADRAQIPSDLPLSYQLATGENRCGNCLAFNAASEVCMQWMQPVRLEYICPRWTSQTIL